MGRFEDWLRRPGAPLRDRALAAWLEANMATDNYLPLQQNARRVLELEDRFRAWDAHRHALQETMDASAEELHANMLGEYLEREWRDLDDQLRRTPWDQRPVPGMDEERSEITRRLTIQRNRARMAQRRYDEAREECMPSLRPSRRDVHFGIRGNWRPIRSVEEHYDRFERTGHLHGAHYQNMHLADITHDQERHERQEHRRGTAELSQNAQELTEAILGRHSQSPQTVVPRNLYSCCMKTRYAMLQSTTGPWRKKRHPIVSTMRQAQGSSVEPTCHPGMKRKFDDESRRGGGGGAGSVCT